jgi:hypothetical protein
MSGIVGSKFNHRGSGTVGKAGTDGQHLLSSGAGKKHVFETVTVPESYDDELIKSDLTALALREATNESSAAFNLPSSFVDTFSDDTNLGTQTTVDRTSGYISSIYSSFGAQALVDRTAGTILGDFNNGSGGGQGAAFDDNTNQAWNVGAYAGSGWHSGNIPYLGKDWGSGNVRYMTGFKFWSSNNDGTSSNPGHTSSSLILLGHTANVPASATVLGTLSSLNFRTNNTEFSKLDITRGTGYRYHWIKVLPNNTNGGDIQCAELKFYEDPLTTSANATGTLIQSANSVTGSRTSVGGTMLYADEDGTATIGTDLKIYFTANGGTNWTEAASYNAITPVYASGIKQVRLGKTTVTGGTDVRYKAVWANQSDGSKETRLHGIGINY